MHCLSRFHAPRAIKGQGGDNIVLLISAIPSTDPMTDGLMLREGRAYEEWVEGVVGGVGFG